VVVFSACSGETKESPGMASTSREARSDVAPTRGGPDACALVLKADVDAAFAPRVFETGEVGRGNVAGTAKLASVSGCTFTSRGASVKEMMTVSLIARHAPNDQGGVTVATAKDGAAKLNATPVDVQGLGDAAYWINLGGSKRPVIELNVFKGQRLWLVFSASAATVGSDATLAGLTKVAETALGRL
jgi:hypothetical protein